MILAILSIYSLTLSGERWWRYRSAKKQSLQFALLTTQYLEEAEQLADRIAILRLGRMVAQDRLSEFDRQSVVDFMTTGVSSRTVAGSAATTGGAH